MAEDDDDTGGYGGYGGCVLSMMNDKFLTNMTTLFIMNQSQYMHWVIGYDFLQLFELFAVESLIHTQGGELRSGRVEHS